MVTHNNLIHNCNAVLDHAPVGVSWLPQYHDMGLIGYYLFMLIKGGTTYGFSSIDFIRRPALWLETITKYKGTASSAPNFAYDYCLQPGKIPEKILEQIDLSSLTILQNAAEPVRADTYSRFLEFFKPYGLRPESFYAAFGLAENTLGVSSYGRNILSVETNSLKKRKIEHAPQDKDSLRATQIMSCGTLLGDQSVKIVDPDTCTSLGDGYVGEVWVTGKSKCLGYWAKPEMNTKVFKANLDGENGDSPTYLRTGDMGFILEGELYICGRLKDMIIVRGLNYFPQDIEKITEESSGICRKGSVVAFDIEVDGEEQLVVVAGVKHFKTVPDPLKISDAIRTHLGIQPHVIAFIPARSIPKTSSGKVRRQMTKQLWLEGNLDVLHQYIDTKKSDVATRGNDDTSPFSKILDRYGLSGTETCSLANAGLDSIDLAVLLHDVKELLERKGAHGLANQIDLRLLQELSVADFSEIAKQLKETSTATLMILKKRFITLQKEHIAYEQSRMIADSRPILEIISPEVNQFPETGSNVLLTGGTGFFGPFLIKTLLRQTNQKIYVLVRASNVREGKDRLRSAMKTVEPFTSESIKNFDERIVPVCGDLEKQKLGLDSRLWDFLAETIDTIYHNGAVVNYLYNYDKMRKSNVIGTNEVLSLAMERRRKVFNHISTTFIFGWAVKDTLFETDTNSNLDLLDFGYSQTKYVSEKIVTDAMSHGLDGRIFRPALITPSVGGGGYNFDISVRLLAFMINHGIGVDTFNQVSFTPADVAAGNIVAISNLRDTVGQTFHVVRDDYYKMIDYTSEITRQIGREFDHFKLPRFVPEIINRCTEDDLLFPLLDFLVRSQEKISSMEFKRYDSTNYQEARNRSEWGEEDPTLEDTVKGLVSFLQSNDLIPNAEMECKQASI